MTRSTLRATALLAVAILGYVSSARAESGVLIDHLPAGADPAIVMSLVRQSLLRHGWTVTSSTDATIEATVNRNTTDGELAIRVSGGRMTYDGKAVMRYPSSGGVMNSRPRDLPERWLRTLRQEVAAGLATLPLKN